MKYHISEDGVARQCRAVKGKCRLNQPEDQHFTTREEAQDFANKQNAQKYGKTANLRKGSAKTAVKGFKKIEERNIDVKTINIATENFGKGNINSSTVDLIDDIPTEDLYNKIYSSTNLYNEL